MAVSKPSSLLQLFLPTCPLCQSARAALDRAMTTCHCWVAAEHAMMERLVIDDLLHWARTYRVRCMGNRRVWTAALQFI